MRLGRQVVRGIWWHRECDDDLERPPSGDAYYLAGATRGPGQPRAAQPETYACAESCEKLRHRDKEYHERRRRAPQALHGGGDELSNAAFENDDDDDDDAETLDTPYTELEKRIAKSILPDNSVDVINSTVSEPPDPYHQGAGILGR